MNNFYKTIPSYPAYSISVDGKVRRDKVAPGTKVGHILKPHLTNKGYWRVRLSLGSRSQFARPMIHQLIAETFIGPRPEGYDINHKDGDRTNNSIENLEYVTRRDNVLDGFKRGRISIPPRQIGSKHPRSILTESAVSTIREILSLGIPYWYIAEQIGVSKYAIHDIKQGKSWQHI